MTSLPSRRTSVVVDLFAGPGGWSEGLRMHRHAEVGIEWDEAACLTARAAGHERVQADVAAIDPADYPCWGLIASPPCQAWSMAGKGGGRRDVEHVIACALELAAGNDTRAEHAAKCEDERSMLVVEPLRWALANQPTWIAMEQVPPVLELWTLFAQLLEQHGWNTWAGVLEAERYGVPQTRERAVLMAHREKVVHPPRATHQRYVPGEPQRHDITLEGEVLPWVSMAQALGWDAEDRVGFPRKADGGAATEDGYRARDFRDGSEPAFNLTEKARSVTRIALKTTFGEPGDRGDGTRKGATPTDRPAPVIDTKARSAEWVMRANKQANAAIRPAPAPAPTITGGHDSGDRVWEARPPSTQALREDWPTKRPATTVAGDPRQFPPGGHHIDGDQSRDAVRVTVQEAAVLQSFRHDYPWQGSRSKQFQQVGNAVPPLLAAAVLGELLPTQADLEAAA